MSVLLIVLVYLALAAVYLVPSIIGYRRRIAERRMLLLANIMFGWSPVWFVCLWVALRAGKPRLTWLDPRP
jgi:hypothetical protein